MLPLIFSMLSLIVLVLDSKTAYMGASDGISLCIKTVIPALFPMMVCSIIITGNRRAGSGQFNKILTALLGVPSGSEALLLTGLIGGYPVGAACISRAYQSGQLDASAARRMLGFCNNAGPAFIFGMAASLFRSAVDPWILWIIHMLSALFTGVLLPDKQHRKAVIIPNTNQSIAAAVPAAIKALASVCGWVMLFKIILTFLDRWFLWMLPDTIKCMINGTIELTNGVLHLSTMKDEAFRFLYATIFLSLGGICVLMQTASVCSFGLGMYIPGKVVQTSISVLLSIIWIGMRWRKIMLAPFLISMAILGSFAIYWGKPKITVAFPDRFVYNKGK